MSRALAFALLLSISWGASAPGPARAAPPQLTLQTTDGRPVPTGAALTASDRLVFHVEGEGWLYVLEQGGGGLSVAHPPSGDAQPPTDGATSSSEGWEPRADGPLEYLLVSSPAPRDSAATPATVDEFLAPPPYVDGPMGEPARVVARLSVRRGDVTVEEPDE